MQYYRVVFRFVGSELQIMIRKDYTSLHSMLRMYLRDERHLILNIQQSTGRFPGR